MQIAIAIIVVFLAIAGVVALNRLGARREKQRGRPSEPSFANEW
jgi:hypothetical protein